MMGLFRNRQSASWHRSITQTAAEHHPITITTEASTPNPNFPWLKLQEHTDEYVKKKKRLTPEQIEARLVEFIRVHADRMDVAIAACGRRLRSETLKGLLLSDFNVAPGKELSMSTYLQAIVAANRVNPLSVSDLEAQRANSMIAAAITGAEAPGNYLHELVKIVIAGVPPTFLIYTHLRKSALKTCTDFAVQVQSLRNAGQLRKAHAAVSWLANISDLTFQAAPENLGPEQFLDIAFPSWRCWATWKPNEERLALWERFSDEECVALKGLLTLEGPDFVGKHNTMGNEIVAGGRIASSSPVHVGGILLEPQLAADMERTIYRLLVSIDAAAGSGPGDTRLLIHQCASKTITDISLQILEGIRAAGDPSISSLLLATYGAGNEPRSTRMAAAMRILPLLNHDQRQTLRDLLFPHLVTLITNGIKDMQAILTAQLETHKVVDNTEIKLQAFGTGLLNNVWILPFLDWSLLTLLGEWPTKAEIVTLHKLRISVETGSTRYMLSLSKRINRFCKSRLIEHGVIDKAEERLIEALISLWDEPPNYDLRSVALYLTQLPGLDSKIVCRCLSLLPMLQPAFLSALLPITQNFDQQVHISCIHLAKLLAPIPYSSSDPTHSWRFVLHDILKTGDVRIVHNCLRELDAVGWVEYLSHLRVACGGIDSRGHLPPMLNLTLLAWGQRLESYKEVLTSLEKVLFGHRHIVRSLLYVDEEAEVDHLEDLLESFKKAEKIHNAAKKPVMVTIIKLLTHENVTATSKVLSLVLASSKDGIDACIRVLELHHARSTKLVAEALLAAWTKSSGMGQLDQSMLKALAEMLGINIASETGTPTASLEAAADYLDAQFAELFAEAQRLEGLRAAYKRVDPEGISKLLSHLKIEDPSPMDDLIALLPSSLVGVVEMVDDEAIEMQFPLKFTPLQRIATGVGNAQSLILRLAFTDYPKQPGFCIHLDNEKTPRAKSRNPVVHVPWEASMHSIIPAQHPCFGRPNRTTYQLTRVLSRHLHSGFRSLEEIHKLITTAIEDLNTTCLVCGTPKATQLRRAGTCQLVCSNLFLGANLEVRLADIRNDPPAMDLLLTMVHYAAASRKLELLPGCPFPNTLAVANALGQVPNLSKLTNVDDLPTAVQKLGSATEKLLSWTALAYGGFLVSATGKMRIPGWPANTRQFLMANANPTLEAAFRQQVGSLPTRVLWHGTSLERLFAITTEGLKICSNTSLQANGAASGPGIYTADSPQTSWSYSPASTVANWSGSSISKVRVLLGLEAAGPAVGGGVHVVTNVNSLMVRYVFLVPSGASVPGPTVMVPAMLSVYNSLRAGAL
jgi:hypothetical protein